MSYYTQKIMTIKNCLCTKKLKSKLYELIKKGALAHKWPAYKTASA